MSGNGVQSVVVRGLWNVNERREIEIRENDGGAARTGA